MLFTFTLPILVFWMAAEFISEPVIFAIALTSAFVGIFIERWLFFAETRHVVNLYHGTQQC